MNTADMLRARVASWPEKSTRQASLQLWDAAIVRVASVLDAVARCKHLPVRRDGVTMCWWCGSTIPCNQVEP